MAIRWYQVTSEFLLMALAVTRYMGCVCYCTKAPSNLANHTLFVQVQVQVLFLFGFSRHYSSSHAVSGS